MRALHSYTCTDEIDGHSPHDEHLPMDLSVLPAFCDQVVCRAGKMGHSD